ncbi:TPA: hypothetical protein O9L84_001026 [Staphylococcus aureus]|uniref:hypothetical protein n=1 Tax=Staphylococcus aureus TaxID=1280 RepID=UPI0015843330|nr:hypothetical protein [Staphylococcus aureus]MCB8347974.1 hypothetical protein [Staphylococcus aureus]MCQ1332690.1 hypothetical protein [Staphylococcus aureus]HAR5380108.1 hypothetical protein [Staphylococcus aureus]HAR5649371.1 hypothetical protein [Staphylococcus aureus]HBM8064437.1 hypothetical protein [Staphylococcus aureus]
MKAGIEGLIQLIRESFNIDNVKKLIYKKLKFSNIAFFSILIIILVLLSINLINDKPKFMKELFSQLINFFGVLIGFTITTLVFLAGTFVDFKHNQLNGYDEEVKIKICKQISATFILSIVINLSIVLLGLIYNNLLFNIRLNVSDYILDILNILGFVFVYSAITLAILLIFRSIFFLKKYIDMIISTIKQKNDEK